jgi:hypothetical protein
MFTAPALAARLASEAKARAHAEKAAAEAAAAAAANSAVARDVKASKSAHKKARKREAAATAAAQQEVIAKLWQSFVRRLVKLDAHNAAKTLEHKLESAERCRRREEAKAAAIAKQPKPLTAPGSSHSGHTVYWKHAPPTLDEKAREIVRKEQSIEEQIKHEEMLREKEGGRLAQLEARKQARDKATAIQQGY